MGSIKKLTLALLLGLGISASANAAFIPGQPITGSSLLTGGLCSLSQQTGGISQSNLTLNNNSASDCYGLVDIGGNVQDEIANINAIGWGTTFNATNFIKDDIDNNNVTNTFLGMTWTLSAPNDSNGQPNPAAYTLSVADNDLNELPALPFTVDIIGFLKAGTPGAFYFFDDVVINTNNNGTFQIAWTVGGGNGNGNNPGLSGLSLFVGQPQNPCTGPNCGGGVQEIPEPASLGLLGLGLLALGAMPRRRKAA